MTPMENAAAVGLYLLGATLIGVPFFTGLCWIVGKFAFTRRPGKERGILVPFWTWAAASLLWTIGGQWLLAFEVAPSFMIIGWLWRRRAKAVPN